MRPQQGQTKRNYTWTEQDERDRIECDRNHNRAEENRSKGRQRRRRRKEETRGEESEFSRRVAVKSSAEKRRCFISILISAIWKKRIRKFRKSFHCFHVKKRDRVQRRLIGGPDEYLGEYGLVVYEAFGSSQALGSELSVHPSFPPLVKHGWNFSHSLPWYRFLESSQCIMKDGNCTRLTSFHLMICRWTLSWSSICDIRFMMPCFTIIYFIANVCFSLKVSWSDRKELMDKKRKRPRA